MMQGPVARILPDGRRLHLQHGPIDLIIDADGPGRQAALIAAQTRFQTILQQLVEEIPLLRRPPANQRPRGSVARRMFDATALHSPQNFITPMAAVAGSVADETLAAMRAAGALQRAYVNNGGDIALHLAPGETYRIGLAALSGTTHGKVTLTAADGIGGIASSGTGGRSLSLGIADSVTILAASASAADAAATLIANEVDLPGHPAIHRAPAHSLDPDSDLGAQQVVTDCGALSSAEIHRALDHGMARAQDMARSALIQGAALLLRGAVRTINLPHSIAAEVERSLHHA